MTSIRPRSSYWKAKSNAEKTLERLIHAALLDNGLIGWTVIFSKDSHKYGYCDYMKKEICISRRVVASSWTEAVDTAMHEVAHALTPGDAHGDLWKAVAIRLGANPAAESDHDLEDQIGKRMILPTKYGRVIFTVGDVVEVSQGVGKLRILEVVRGKFVGESKMGSRYRLPVDMLHPNYGDPKKIVQKIVMAQGSRKGHKVPITLGKSYAFYDKDRYYAIEVRGKYVIAVGPNGARNKFFATSFRGDQ